MTKKRNIALIGARGAGKSKIARKLSKLTGLVSLSTDTLISYEENGRTISSIVAERGWPGFRNLESDILEKVSGMTGVIIDCGGGILFEAADENGIEPLSARKIALLRESSYVIYLKREMDYLLKKVKKGDPNRPDLSGAYQELLKRRLPVYESQSDYTLDMTRYDIDRGSALLIDLLATEVENFTGVAED